MLQFIVFSSGFRAHDEGVTQSVVRLLSQEGYEAQQLEAEDAFPDAVAAADVIMVEVGDAEDSGIVPVATAAFSQTLAFVWLEPHRGAFQPGSGLGRRFRAPPARSGRSFRAARFNALLRRTGLKRSAPPMGLKRHAD